MNLISAVPAFVSYRSSLGRTLRSFAPEVIYANGFKAQIFSAMVNRVRADWYGIRTITFRRVRLFPRCTAGTRDALTG